MSTVVADKVGLIRKALLAACLTGVLPPALAALPEQPARLSAVVKAFESATLSSQSNGLVIAVSHREGDAFDKGDVLIELDCESRSATLSRAHARLGLATAEVATAEALARLNSASEMQVARASAEQHMAEADVRIARQEVGQCIIKAPFAGHVVDSQVRAHEVVQENTQLLEIVNNDSVYLEFLAPSQRAGDLDPEQALRFDASETGRSYQVLIERVVPQVDSVNQTVRIIGRIEASDASLWAGMSGWIHVE